tara:strand:+ start:449 stop:628 length:180 start_codon:yes stop_codon:yes gene_type:complete
MAAKKYNKKKSTKEKKTFVRKIPEIIIPKFCIPSEHNLIKTEGITRCDKCNFKYISYLS